MLNFFKLLKLSHIYSLCILVLHSILPSFPQLLLGKTILKTLQSVYSLTNTCYNRSWDNNCNILIPLVFETLPCKP